MAETSFEKAFAFTLDNETPNNNLGAVTTDNGGITKYGISQNAFPNLDIASLTLDQARQIYKKNYWDNQPYSQINDTDISTKIFDLGFNMGSITANKLAQRALRSCTGNKLLEDGLIGPITLNLINQKPIGLLQAIKSEAAGYYRSIVIKIPILSSNLIGWLNRAYL